MRWLLTFIKEFFLENTQYKIVALLIASVLWATVLARRDVVYIKTVDLEYLLHEKHVITNDVINQITVRLAGSRAALKKYAQLTLTPITVDLTNARLGSKTIQIPEESLKLPIGVRVVSIMPSHIMLNLGESVGKKVPVQAGQFPAEIRDFVRVLEVIPNEVEIRGAAAVVQGVANLKTEDIPWTPKIEALWKNLKAGESMDIQVRLFPVQGTKFGNIGSGTDGLTINIKIERERRDR